MTESNKIIYTLGTNRRTEEDFIEILNAYGIERLIDVRRFPTSKFPHFKKESLARLLKDNGIEYFFLGEELGGYRKGGYEEYVLTENFRSGIEELVRLSEVKRSVIICAERFPWKCHRRWIARELSKHGWKVIHIIDKGKEWIP